MTAENPPDELPLVAACFPDLAEGTQLKLRQFVALVRDWNTRLNLVSRKDVENLEAHHLMHSLALLRVLRPADGAAIADFGTGGGFPGLPLAIAFPECKFTLVDSIAKKARAVQQMAGELGLENVRVITARAEQVRDRFDYVLGRAVAALPRFLELAAPRLRTGSAGDPANGVLYFKGTLWREELAGSPTQPSAVWELESMFPGRPFFVGKFLLHFAAPIALPPAAPGTGPSDRTA